MMQQILQMLVSIKALFLAVSEAGFALLAFIVLVYLLLGEDSGAYVISVVTNITLLINALTLQAMVAIALVVALYYLVRKRL